MATNLETIESGLRKLGVLDIEESATATMGTIGLRCLNQMCTRWEANSVPLGYTTQTSLAATTPVPEEAQSAVEFNLALEMEADFAVAAPANVRERAATLLREVTRDAFIVTPNDMRHAPGYRSRWNINTDE